METIVSLRANAADLRRRLERAEDSNQRLRSIRDRLRAEKLDLEAEIARLKQPEVIGSALEICRVCRNPLRRSE